MTGQRTEFRETDFADAPSAARNINDTLRDLYSRLERLERYEFVDLKFTTDPVGVPTAMSIAPPRWPVKGLVAGWAFNLTTRKPVALLVAWAMANGTISVTPYGGLLSVSTSYLLRVEVCG